MKLGQMFPSRYLRPDDLKGRTVVTIEKVDWQQVRNQYGQNKGEPEVLYTVFFREFKKPMKLKSTNAKTIAKVLSTEETDDWINRQVTIYPTEIRIAGEPEPVPCIYVDWVAPPSTAPQLNAAQPAGLTAAIDVRPIGKGSAENFRTALAEQGATFDDFLKWLRKASFETYERVFGVDLEDIPRAAAPLMMRFLKEFGTAPASETPAAPPATAAATDATPAVETAPPRPNLDPARRSDPTPLGDDDIPF